MVGNFTLRWRWGEQGDSHWHSNFFKTEKHQLFINKTIFLNHSEQKYIQGITSYPFLSLQLRHCIIRQNFQILKISEIRGEMRTSTAR